MVENDRPRQGLKGRSRTRIRASRLVRRVRLRRTIRAVQKRERPTRAACLASRLPRRACGNASCSCP